jgi:phosphatidylglycerophosphatase A
MSVPISARVVLRHPAGWLASGLGVGLIPRAPGTFGSLAALIPWWLWLRHLPPFHYLAFVAIAFAVGVWASHWLIKKTRIDDPGVVVCDEFVGQWIALALAPSDWRWVAVGFVLFRLFDIAKPWPVGWADRKLHGGFGAMFDDALAGLYALAALQAFVYWADWVVRP